MKILVTGTPGVGKTTFSKRIAERLGIHHVDITAYIKKHRLYESYDHSLNTFIFSENLVAEDLKHRLRNYNSFIIDTHSPVIVKHVDFDKIVMLRCSTAVLKTRLEERGYSKEKIQENIECEICEVIRDDLEECFGKDPIVVYTSEPEDEGLEFEEAIDAICQEALELEGLSENTQNIINCIKK